MAANQQFCTFYLENLLFGVEIQRVQEVLHHISMTHVPLAAEAVSGLINLRGQIVTAIDLRRCMAIKDRPPEQLPTNIVIRSDDGSVSLLVDEIGDVLDVEMASAEPPPETLREPLRSMVRGVYKLADELLLELDIQRVIAEMGKETVSV